MTESNSEHELHEQLCERVRAAGRATWSARFRGEPQAVSKREEVMERELAVIGRLGMSRAYLTVAEIREIAEERGIPTVAWYGKFTSSLVLDALGLNPLDPIELGLYWESIFTSKIPLHVMISVGHKRTTEMLRGLTARDLLGSFFPVVRRPFPDETYYEVPERSRPAEYNTSADTSYRHTIRIAWDREMPGIAVAHGGRLPRLDDPALRDPALFAKLAQGRTKGLRFLFGRSGRELIERMKPKNVAEVAAAITLNRPGPKECRLVDAYLDKRVFRPPVGTLQEVTADSRRKLLYFEQAYRLLLYLGLESVAEAREFCMSAWSDHARFIPMLRKLNDGARVRGIPDVEVDAITSCIMTGAQQLYPKSYCYGAAWMLLAELSARGPQNQFARASKEIK